MTRLLFVCLGNICRSPAAEGVMRARAEAAGLPVTLDSAGTGDWHAGDPPDRRMTAAARKRGIDLTGLRARQVRPRDFEAFDLVLAMDRANLDALSRLRPAPSRCQECSWRPSDAFAPLPSRPTAWEGGNHRQRPG